MLSSLLLLVFLGLRLLFPFRQWLILSFSIAFRSFFPRNDKTTTSAEAGHKKNVNNGAQHPGQRLDSYAKISYCDVCFSLTSAIYLHFLSSTILHKLQIFAYFEDQYSKRISIKIYSSNSDSVLRTISAEKGIPMLLNSVNVWIVKYLITWKHFYWFNNWLINGYDFIGSDVGSMMLLAYNYWKFYS